MATKQLIFIVFLNLIICRSQIDPFTSQWSQPDSVRLPNGQSSLLVGYHEPSNKMWLIGGDDPYGNRDEIWSYDLTSNTFTDEGYTTTHLDELYAQSSTQIGNSIYFVNAGELLRFDMGDDFLTSNFTTLRALGTNVLSPCLASKDDRFLFIVGGESLSATNDGVATFQIYDISDDTLYNKSTLKRKRRFLSCNLSPNGDFLYAFGGRFVNNQGVESPRTSVEKIDVSSIVDPNTLTTFSNSWSLIPTMIMNDNTFYSRSVVDDVNKLIYVIGGRTSATDQPADASISIIDPSTDSLYLSAISLQTARSAPAVINVAQKLYVFGGYTTDDAVLDSFEISNLLSPTQLPTTSPTLVPTQNPTTIPSDSPTTTLSPTEMPTFKPTNNPTKVPSEPPTILGQGAVGEETTKAGGNSEGGKNVTDDSKNSDSTLIIASVCIVIAAMICGCMIIIWYHRKKKKESQQTVKAVDGSTWAQQASTSDVGVTDVSPANGPQKNDVELANTGTAGGEENIYLNNPNHLTTPGMADNSSMGEIYTSNDDEDDHDPLDDDLYSPKGDNAKTPKGVEDNDQEPSLLNEDVDEDTDSEEEIMDDVMYTKGDGKLSKKTPQAPKDE